MFELKFLEMNTMQRTIAVQIGQVRLVLLGLAVLVGVSLTGTMTTRASADELKIATVDMERLLNESKSAKSKRRELENVSNKAKTKLKAEIESLKEREKELKKKKVAEDSEQADEFRVRARDLARLKRDTEEDLKKKYIKPTRDLTATVTKVVEEYAKQHQFSLVLEKSKNARSVVLYRADVVDITPQVLAKLDSE